MEPRLTPIRGGWAAVGQGWAVFATSPDDAVQRFEEAEQRHREIASRPVVDEAGQREATED